MTTTHGANLIEGLIPTITFNKIGMSTVGDPAWLTDGLADHSFSVHCDAPGPETPLVTFEFDLGGTFWVDGFAYVEGVGGPTPPATPAGDPFTTGLPFLFQHYDPILEEWYPYPADPHVRGDSGNNWEAKSNVGQAANAEWIFSLGDVATTLQRSASKVRITMGGSSGGTIEIGEIRVYAALDPPPDFAIENVSAVSPNQVDVLFSTMAAPYYVGHDDPDMLEAHKFTFDVHGAVGTSIAPLGYGFYRLTFDPPIEHGEYVTMTVGRVASITNRQHLTESTYSFYAFGEPLAPTLGISDVAASSATRVNVTFDNDLELADLNVLLIENYTITPSLVVTAVAVVSPSAIAITTAPQSPGQSYTLTIGSLTSVDGALLSDASATFQGFQIPGSGQATTKPRRWIDAQTHDYVVEGGDFKQDDGFTSKVVLALATRLGSCQVLPSFGSRLHEIRYADERGRQLAEKFALMACQHLTSEVQGLAARARIDDKRPGSIEIIVSGRRGMTVVAAQYSARITAS